MLVVAAAGCIVERTDHTTRAESVADLLVRRNRLNRRRIEALGRSRTHCIQYRFVDHEGASALRRIVACAVRAVGAAVAIPTAGSIVERTGPARAICRTELRCLRLFGGARDLELGLRGRNYRINLITVLRVGRTFITLRAAVLIVQAAVSFGERTNAARAMAVGLVDRLRSADHGEENAGEFHNYYI